MRILLIGATGTIGRAVSAALSARHTVIEASRKSASERVDVLNADSFTELVERIGSFDAVICTAGESPVGSLQKFDADALIQGLKGKLFAQIALARLAVPHLSHGGSITLTSGVVSQRSIRGSMVAAIANGGLEGFVRCAALELEHGIRINIVSPSMLKESMHLYGSFFEGFDPVSACDVAQAYVRFVEGKETGQVAMLH